MKEEKFLTPKLNSWIIPSSNNQDIGTRYYKEVLNERTDPKLSTECIMEALDICNIAQFDVTWYRQTVFAGCSYGPHDSCPNADMAKGEINNKQ